MEKYFSGLFGHANYKTRRMYEEQDSDSIEGPNGDYLRGVTRSKAVKALNNLRMDAAAGPDRLQVKILRDLDEHGDIIASIAIVCCVNEKFPMVLQRAKTVLLPKKGDSTLMTNRGRGG